MKTKKILCVLLPAGILYACSAGKDGSDPAAVQLLEQSQAELDAGNPEAALRLVDSLYSTWPAETAVLKEGMLLRPRAMEMLSEQGIARCDSAVEAAKAEIERLRARMKWVNEKGMVEGFWIDKDAYKADFFNTTGVQARVSGIGQFYIVSSVNPGIGHTSVSVSAGGGSASTPAVPHDGESNYRIGGGEVITFSPEQSDTIGKFLASQGGRGVTISFNGKGRRSVKLSAAAAGGMANAWRLSEAMSAGRDNDIERQRLQRQLELARTQQQRLAADASAE